MVKEIVENFVKAGISQAALERALDLQQGDLDKPETPEMVALIRIVGTYPWLLNVAEHHYDENYAKRVLAHVGVDVLMDTQEHIEKHGHDCDCQCKEDKKEQDDGK